MYKEALHSELVAALDGAEEKQPNGDQRLEEEHLRRLKAEAEALDKGARLRVAQEQLAEWASDKAEASAGLLAHAQQVEAALAQLLAPSGAGGAQLLAQVAALKQRLADTAAEARAFSEQQAADCERAKRSSQAAQLMDVDAGEPKRARDNSDDTSSDADKARQPGDDSGSSSSSSSSSEDDTSLDPALAAALPVPDPAAPPGAAHNGGGPLRGLSGSAGPGSGRLSFRERCKYIPLRLKLEERRLLRLLEAALNVSEYTDKVDVLAWRSKTSRVHAQLKDFCAILSGLVVAQDYKRGQELVAGKEFADNAGFFRAVFEIGRRYKIMNPEKMRSEFGKLMYMLMDSADSHVQELLGFSCVGPLQTVASFLEGAGAGGLLDEPLLEAATAEIPSAGRPRPLVQRDIKAKERAREALARKYRSSSLSEEDVLWALYSIADNNAFLAFNRDPIDRMIRWFTATYQPTSWEEGCSLAITGGRDGARLSHSHERQYHYVLQTLMLWREINTDMFKLWLLAESDMLREGSSYRLCDTGQGLNRLQAAPLVGRAMQAILSRCQAALGGWVGSSVVHLGDHNVPNALFFLNKYTQVPQILNPLVLVLDQLPRLARDNQIAAYINASFGSLEAARKAILTDFARHAFDGSGADNFFSAGSCIDGRLTSAWNWCSKIEAKPYYPLFKLAGFVGFDGDFK